MRQFERGAIDSGIVHWLARVSQTIDEKYDIKGSVVNRFAKKPGEGTRQICKYCRQEYTYVTLDPVKLFKLHMERRRLEHERLGHGVLVSRDSFTHSAEDEDAAPRTVWNEQAAAGAAEAMGATRAAGSVRGVGDPVGPGMSPAAAEQSAAAATSVSALSRQAPTAEPEHKQPHEQLPRAVGNALVAVSRMRQGTPKDSASNVYCDSVYMYHQPQLLLKDNDLRCDGRSAHAAAPPLDAAAAAAFSVRLGVEPSVVRPCC